jgi:uncharacterized repeat protein (TIGR03803 family)
MLRFQRLVTLLLAAAFLIAMAANAKAVPHAAIPVAARATVDTVLYSFGGPTGGGSSPYSGVIVDATGVVYGTAYSGGAGHYGVVFALKPPAAGQTAWTEQVLHAFTDANGDGGVPFAGLIEDTHGALYGTTAFGGDPVCKCGTVFKLTPPPAGQSIWTQTVLYKFTGRKFGDGYEPWATLIADANGNLYGTTVFGGDSKVACEGSAGAGCGTVFELVAPAAGGTTWTEVVLHDFTGANGDGDFPKASLVADAAGNLYGTTAYGGASCSIRCGTVFELTPPPAGQSAWNETVLHSFSGTHGDGADLETNLIIDAHGALYGTTIYGGSYAAKPYCQRSGCGTIFALSPPPAGQSGWAESILRTFTGDAGGGRNPIGGLLFGPNGVLYGTTGSGGVNHRGTVFELTPPPPGQTSWTESVLTRFLGHPDEAAFPIGDLGVDASGALYGTSSDGGAYDKGTIFRIPGAFEARVR